MRACLLSRRQWWLAAMAAGGVAVTHALTYWLIEPEASHRAELLHETGHHAWPPFVVPAMLGALVLGLPRAATRRVGAPLALRATTARLGAP
ncbi:MAG TPA: hypothetical protein VNB24_03685 [Acidimicrobiales bacterium]|nr:hypothetical protein [Acidimicrobiales bacterium]